MNSGRKWVGPDPSEDEHILNKETLDAVRGTLERKVFHIVDAKAYNVSGGSSIQDAWQTRILNTVISNSISGASLSSNRFTLPAGTYLIQAEAPCYKGDQHQIRLYNYTDSAQVGLGTIEYGQNGLTVENKSILWLIFTITGSKAFEIQHIIEDAYSSHGLGVQNDSFSLNNYFTQVWIEKV